MENRKSNKIIYLEFLRITAILFVIFNHTGEQGFLLFENTSLTALRIISIVLSSISKIGVPLFFMISGALLINKEETVKELFVKRILRIIIILVVFSFIYYVRLYIRNPEYGFSIKFFFRMIYEQPVITPFWFLYSYLAFLVILPFVRKLARGMTDDEYAYFLIMAAAMNIGLTFFEGISGWNRYFSVSLLSTNICYPLLGYYCEKRLDLAEDKVSKLIKERFALPVLFIVNELIIIFLTCFDKIKNGCFTDYYVSELLVLPSVCIFLLARRTFNKLNAAGGEHLFMERAVCFLGSCSLSVYLFEEIIREDLLIGFINTYSPSFVSLVICIVYTPVVFIIGSAFSAVLKRIPIVRNLKL